MVHADAIREAVLGGPPAKAQLAVGDLLQPNGLAFSPDFSKLYVSESDSSDPHWRVYDVQPDGTLENGQVFVNKGIPDGMKARPHCVYVGIHPPKRCVGGLRRKRLGVRSWRRPSIHSKWQADWKAALWKQIGLKCCLRRRYVYACM
jgi:hypothetical protein